MTQHIKIFIFIFILNISLTASDIFSFYKAYSVCDSNISAYSQLEANNLYKNKKIDFSKYVQIEMDENDINDLKEDSECLFANMDISIVSIKKYKYINESEDIWPFNKIFYINDKYLLTGEDGFYFIFALDENKKTRDVIALKQYLYKNSPKKTEEYLEKTMSVDILKEDDNWVYVKAKTKKGQKGWIPKSALE